MEGLEGKMKNIVVRERAERMDYSSNKPRKMSIEYPRYVADFEC